MHLVRVVDSFGAVHEVIVKIDSGSLNTPRDLKEQIVEQNLELIALMPELRFNYGVLNIKDMFYMGA